MAKASRLPLLLTGLGAFVLLRKAAQGAYKGIVVEEVMDYRNKMYDVGPNCEITMKSSSDSGGDAGEDLEALWEEFAWPIVEEAWSAGKYSLEEVTAAVMEKLFPEEQCTWPPKEESPQSQWSAFYFMMTFIAGRLACGFDGEEALPEGQTCLTVVISEKEAKAIQASGIALGMMAKGFGGSKGLAQTDEGITISYRVPEDAKADA